MDLNVGDYMDIAESNSTEFLRKVRKVLPFVAKLLLLGTYFEDGLRMVFQFTHQAEHFAHIWKTPYFLSCLFVIFIMVSQIVPATLILLNKHEKVSILSLAVSVLFQGIVYKTFADFNFCMRLLSILGSLLILYSFSSKVEDDMDFIFGGPLGAKESSIQNRSYMLLLGRFLVACIFSSTIVSEEEWSHFITYLRIAISIVLMVGILVGYKTTFVSIVASLWFLLMNLIHNSFWNYELDTHLHDYYKFEFFQFMSLIGGLVTLVNVGPGGVSIDERKKKW